MGLVVSCCFYSMYIATGPSGKARYMEDSGIVTLSDGLVGRVDEFRIARRDFE